MAEIARLDKILSTLGMSRTDAKKAVASGRVMVDGKPERDPGRKAAPEQVLLDGKPIVLETEIHLMIHKPAGVVTATEDKKLPTVVSLLPEKYRKRKIGPVGRLDRDVTGLVLMTTDGQLAHRLISPKWKAEKVYRARCEGRLEARDIDAFAAGIDLGDFTARPARLEILEAADSGSVADVALTEGKFHQVKRMFAAVGHPLVALERRGIGGVALDGTLAPGEYRALTEDEVGRLKRLCALAEA